MRSSSRGGRWGVSAWSDRGWVCRLVFEYSGEGSVVSTARGRGPYPSVQRTESLVDRLGEVGTRRCTGATIRLVPPQPLWFAHEARAGPSRSHSVRFVCGRPESRPHGQRDAERPALLTSLLARRPLLTPPRSVALRHASATRSRPVRLSRPGLRPATSRSRNCIDTPPESRNARQLPPPPHPRV